MNLHEMRIGSEPIEAITFSQIGKKKKESEELAAQIEEFIANGGKITGSDTTELNPRRFNDSSQDQAERARTNNRKKCVKASMNSKFYPTNFQGVFHSDANREKFVFIIGKYISKQFDRVHQAVNHRDFYLKKLENESN